MIQLTYAEACNLKKLQSDNIQVFVFRYYGPGCCNSWVDNVLLPLADNFKEYNWVEIFMDLEDVPFRPDISPTFYVYTPNWIHPFIFKGEKSYSEYNNIFTNFLKIKQGYHATTIFDTE